MESAPITPLSRSSSTVGRSGFAIFTYTYYRSAGSCPDRKIDFYRQTDRTIVAHCYAKETGEWKEISVVQNDRIFLDQERTTKTARLPRSLTARRRISELTIDEQDSILNNIGPSGPNKIDVDVSLRGLNPAYEGVTSITIWFKRRFKD